MPTFQTLRSDLLDQVVATARPVSFEARQRIFYAGEKARAFYSVRSGSVKLFRLAPDGREQIVHIIQPGQNFAEAAVLSLGMYPVTAEAQGGPTELLEFRGDLFMKLLKDRHELATSMISSLCMRVLRLVERVEDLSVSRVDCRFARHLLRLPAQRGTCGAIVQLGSSKKDLAHQLGMTPETLSRVLRRMRDDGVLRVAGRECTLTNEDRLLAIADGDGE